MNGYIPANSIERYEGEVKGVRLLIEATPYALRTHWRVSCPDRPDLGEVSMWTDDPTEAVRAWMKKVEAEG